jgi:hypothetical protein
MHRIVCLCGCCHTHRARQVPQKGRIHPFCAPMDAVLSSRLLRLFSSLFRTDWACPSLLIRLCCSSLAFFACAPFAPERDIQVQKWCKGRGSELHVCAQLVPA